MHPRFRDDRRRDQPRLNHRIRVPQVRVVGSDGSQMGIMPTPEALRRAEEEGLDLVEVSPKAVPPVCKILDYGKFKFEEAKRKRPTAALEIKEIKLRPKTEEHDIAFKARHAQRFLGEGHKVRLVIVFRGREVIHPHTGKAMLDRFVAAVGEGVLVDVAPRMEDRRMTMVLAPKPGATKKPASPSHDDRVRDP